MSQDPPSSSQESNWRSRRRPPPPRLSWPAGSSQGGTSSQLTQAAQSSQQDDDDRKPSARKRPRKSVVPPKDVVTSLEDDSSLSSSSSSSMWVDKHAPTSSTELCVAPKKVKEVRAFIESATGKNRASCKKLLVLSGSPGIGKSTMLRLLAKEMKLDVCDWNESHNPRTYNAGGGGGSNSSGLLSVEESSPLDSFEEFLQQSGAGFSSLLLQLANVTTPAVSSLSTATTTSSTSQQSIILLEDLPNLHGPEAELRFRKVMSNHLKRSQVPTVLIFSDVSEGKHRPDDLERLIDPKDLYSEDVSTILQIHPVTKPKMKKILERITNKQGCQVPSVFWEQVHDQSRGDLRHAILTLQLESSGRTSLVTNQLRHNDRDVKLSTFHALGKLLYAKRTLQNGKLALAYDPELTMERSDMGLGGSLGFLEYHSVEFFQDITELSDAMDYYSDAATMLDFPMDGQRGDSNFPEGYVASLAGRAVAKTNTNPTPNKFRQFSTPKVFEVIRKRRQNQIIMQQLSKRLGYLHLSPASAFGSSQVFVTDFLPAMRRIVPGEVNPSIENMLSVAQQQSSSKRGDGKRREMDNETEMEEKKAIKVQEEILGEDDIVDDSSDDDDDMPPPPRKPVVVSTKKDHDSNHSPTSIVADPLTVPPEIIVIDDD